MNRLLLAALILLSLPVSAVDENEVVPDFTLKTMQGDNLRLEELRGQVVLINFWASWCGPCRQEMPILQKIHNRYETMGFTVLGVNVDENTVKAFKIASRTALDFPLLLDTSQKVSEQFGVDAMPFSVLVDRNGVVEYIHRGYKPGDENAYVDRLRPLLRQKNGLANQAEAAR